ncbi:MAG: hypothetical protein NT157_02250 [Candidatus Micrarchaeota archaeon]|nr:hypothetical protein [Candidatus Micrarchaeota archaeon]
MHVFAKRTAGGPVQEAGPSNERVRSLARKHPNPVLAFFTLAVLAPSVAIQIKGHIKTYQVAKRFAAELKVEPPLIPPRLFWFDKKASVKITASIRDVSSGFLRDLYFKKESNGTRGFTISLVYDKRPASTSTPYEVTFGFPDSSRAAEVKAKLGAMDYRVMQRVGLESPEVLSMAIKPSGK